MPYLMNFDNANDLYKEVILDVENNYDYESAPRGKKIKEKLAYQCVLLNPLNSLITIKERKLNYRFAIIEKLEYLYGKHDAERLIAYNPNMKNYAGNYNYFDGNYAQRFNFWIDHIYNLLKSDADSRQAVISIYGETARHQSLDIPCTLTLQFLIRNKRLHLIVNMRSNDLLWGFPYDINAFCFLQEVMAKWLGVEIGTYTHQAGSIHIYTDNEENHRQLLSCASSVEEVDIHNPKWNLTYEETKEWLPKFFSMEARMRRLKQDEPGYLPPPLDEYFKILKTKWIK